MSVFLFWTGYMTSNVNAVGVVFFKTMIKAMLPPMPLFPLNWRSIASSLAILWIMINLRVVILNIGWRWYSWSVPFYLPELL